MGDSRGGVLVCMIRVPFVVVLGLRAPLRSHVLAAQGYTQNLACPQGHLSVRAAKSWRNTGR